MAVSFQCDACGRTGKAKEELAGRIVKCPECQQPVELPPLAEFSEDELAELDALVSQHQPQPPPPTVRNAAPPPPPPIEEPPTQTESPPAKNGWEFVWMRVCIVVAGLTFLVTLFRPPSLTVTVNYAALFLTVLLIGFYLAERTSRRIFLGIFGVLAVVLPFLFYHYDGYTQHWRKRFEDKSTTYYTDSYRRGDRHPYHRRMWINFPERANYFSNGPMSDTGKLHGRWEWFTVDEYETHYEWYWYGEKINEGEWHLRNK